MLLINQIIKVIFQKYSRNSLATINNNILITFVSLPREDAYNCLQNSYISLEFGALEQDSTRYLSNDRIRLVNFEPNASLVKLYWYHVQASV